MISISTYTGPLVVTLAYLTLYYALLTYGLTVRVKLFREHGKTFDRYFNQNRELLAADRMQLNTLEHMSPFLWALWLHAVFISPTSATYAGSIYVISRVIYPFMLGRSLGRGIRSRVFLATFTGYGVLAYLLGTIALRLI